MPEDMSIESFLSGIASALTERMKKQHEIDNKPLTEIVVEFRHLPKLQE